MRVIAPVRLPLIASVEKRDFIAPFQEASRPDYRALGLSRRHAAMRPDPVALEIGRAEWEKKRAAHGAELARMSRALLVAFPPSRLKAAALLHVGAHDIATFVGDELDELRSRLAAAVGA